MVNVLDLQALQVEGFAPYCPSQKSVIVVVTTFHVA
ncbi:hypothetical protein BXY51_008714 [Actinoplanes cyaneus]|nr:hypothetical protein [Actinoplanes cyaneus]